MRINLLIKNRLLISSALFIFLLALVVVFLVAPALAEIRLINRQVYEERVRLEKLYVRGQLQKKVRDTFNNVKDELKFLDSILLKENQELQYITALERSAALSGVALEISIGAAKRVPDQTFSTLRLNFEVSGEWTGIMNWLDRVEALPYYTNIRDLAVAVREGKEDSGNRAATVTVGADTYWLITL